MPRISRKVFEAPFYHVMVQGINRSYIFNNANNKVSFLKTLEKCLEEEKVIMIAYCIMGNHAHLLLKSQSIKEISKCMKRLNTKYALRYNKANDRVGYVFRERFKLEPIYEYNYLHNCIKYIHMNPVKAGICKMQSEYEFSSYKKFLDKNLLQKIGLFNEIFYDETEYINVLKDSEVDSAFIDEEFSKTEAQEWLNRYLKYKNIEQRDIYTNDVIMMNLIKDMKNECKVKNTLIAKILNVSECKISRVLKR